MNQTYLNTVRLLTQVAPFIFAEGHFALKGGTAINLFVRDMPRFSVDLDIVFPDYRMPRDEALACINNAIRQCAEHLKERGYQTYMSGTAGTGETGLLVRHAGIEIKIEVNYVTRGTVYPVRIAALTPTARAILLADMEIPVVSLEDMYGGKLVAAMDRQHPRDLFDVMQLFAHEGITADIRRAFVVYLACHNRSVHEVLFPKLKNIEWEYEHSFKGMTAEPVELSQLLAARERMVHELQSGLDTNERRFLLSLVTGKPEWLLPGIAHAEHLPGIRWKLRNLAQLKCKNPEKFAEQAEVLSQLFAHYHSP
ncbi:MAG: nucleotidyl transferase AbiEii/AbiGii toxin family protein [Azoarcus sp.]|jgi:predicted nucleotidyltransferase component of viral defense system|nr:nucleotidyl transferase AbiEii/AbiGii toxin family protein [Azoarcus sp.]